MCSRWDSLQSDQLDRILTLKGRSKKNSSDGEKRSNQRKSKDVKSWAIFPPERSSSTSTFAADDLIDTENAA